MRYIGIILEIVIFTVLFKIAWGEVHWSMWAIALCLTVMAEGHEFTKAAKKKEAG